MDIGCGLCPGIPKTGSSKDTFYRGSHLADKLSGHAGMIHEWLSRPSECILVWQMPVHHPQHIVQCAHTWRKKEEKMRGGGGGKKKKGKKKVGNGSKWNKNITSHKVRCGGCGLTREE